MARVEGVDDVAGVVGYELLKRFPDQARLPALARDVLRPVAIHLFAAMA